MYAKIKFPMSEIKYPLRWLIGGIISATLIIGSTTAYIIVNRGNRRENITQLTVPVAAKNVTLRIEASGRAVPIKNVNLSPKNQGTLTSLYVEQGDQVKKGQIIARMDSADVRARILQARANLEQSKAQLEQAKNGSRPQEITQAKARLRQVEAQLTAAKVGNRPQEIAQAKAQVASVKARVDLSSERLRRYRALHKEGAVEKDTLDQYMSEDNTAKANLQEAEKRLALLESGTGVQPGYLYFGTRCKQMLQKPILRFTNLPKNGKRTFKFLHTKINSSRDSVSQTCP